jgi:hypothetical protein
MPKKHAIIIGLSLVFACFSQEEQDYQEYLAQKELSPLIVKFGGGTGASYGGWYGVNTEAGFGYVSLIGALGLTMPNTAVHPQGSLSSYAKPAWQVGVRAYLASPATKLRSALSVYMGPVYIYQVELSDTTFKGLLMCVTPVISIEHDIGKPRGIVLTYGIGPVFHKENPEEVDDAIFAMTGKKTLVSLSLNLGINYQLKMKRKNGSEGLK